MSTRRRLAAPFLSVTGGKGGVGKTTLAANLGVSLARAGAKVLVVDADFGLANLDVVLGLEPQRDVEAFFDGEGPLASCVLEGPGGVRVLPAGSGRAELARGDGRRRSRFLDALAELSSAYELVIADCPAGIGPDVLELCGTADHVLVVTTPDPASMTDAYGVIKALDGWSSTSGVEVPTPEVVVNLAAAASEAEKVAAGLERVCRRFLARSPVLGGWLPRCGAVRRAAAERRPFTVKSPASLSSRCLGNLARRVARRAEALAQPFPG